MPIDADHLRQRYASLSDEELIALDRNDLTDTAQQYYDEEMEQRGISVETSHAGDDDSDETTTWEHGTLGEEEGDDEGFIVCTFTDHRGVSSVGEAEEAYAALQAAGIPCRVETHTIESEPIPAESRTEHQVVVPSGFSLQATSVLDKDVFNPRMELDWKTHLESLTDEQLLLLNADVICAGLLDRAARLRKAYAAEVRRRSATASSR